MFNKSLIIVSVSISLFAYSGDAQEASASGFGQDKSNYEVRLELNPNHTMLKPIINCFEGGCVRPYMRFSSIPGESFEFDRAVQNMNTQLFKGERKELWVLPENLHKIAPIESFGDSKHCDGCLGLRASVEPITSILLANIFGALKINNELVFSDAASVALYSQQETLIQRMAKLLTRKFTTSVDANAIVRRYWNTEKPLLVSAISISNGVRKLSRDIPMIRVYQEYLQNK